MYDSINCVNILLLIWKYGVGVQICRYELHVWDEQAFLLQQTSFYSESFLVARGVTQGNANLPIIFNMIINAVLHCLQGEPNYKELECSFYTDNRFLDHVDPQRLQRIKVFVFFGL